MVEITELESAIWSIADGQGTDDDRALLRANRAASLGLLDGLIHEAEDGLASVRTLPGDERDQVVGDFEETIKGLRATAAALRDGGAATAVGPRPIRSGVDQRPPDPVALQASWSGGDVVVWA